MVYGSINMKRVFITIFVALLFSVSAHAEGFNDIEDSQYRESIEALQEEGIVEGYGNEEFRPKNTINRAELIKIVFAALEEEATGNVGGCFEDVGTEWFASYICRAKELKIVNGYDDGRYRPGQDVNMVEALKIASEAFGMFVGEVDNGEAWHDAYRDFAHENNIFSKYAYWPGREASREEVVFLVHKMMQVETGEVHTTRIRNAASSGCGITAPSSEIDEFVVNGVRRKTITAVPGNYDPTKKYALVFAFHGRTSPNNVVRGYYGMEKPSKGQAIFVYPEGTKSGSGFKWVTSEDGDYAFFDVMVEEMTSNYCIDEDKIFAVGHSLGAWFVNSLACARGDVLRGVGTLGGSRAGTTCSGPVAVMQWHNPNDRLASFSSGVNARDAFIRQNQCSTASREVYPFWGNCIQYEGCFEYAPTIWCPHTNDYSRNGEYYPHNWPKGTGEEIWKFFETLNK